MSHSYASNRIHLIFGTKGRQKGLSTELQPKLWAYLAGIAKNHGFEAVKSAAPTIIATA
jgi:REP element-mobilizing transposase RayT